MLESKDIYFFKVNIKDNYDEFWLREDLKEVSSGIYCEFLEGTKIMIIAADKVYKGEITIVLNQLDCNRCVEINTNLKK